ncbi:MAG: translation initiation factor IF-2 [Candidatus Spechtbacterales bacterium]
MVNNTSKNKIRPPVVVIVGHVDHGKTSILDYIRQSKVAEKETGGITQHTGAYQIEHPSTNSAPKGGQAGQEKKKITFIDTPGHEAFSAMRSRGVKVADIAVLVVAADDGVMPQTKEAISIIQKNGLPYVVAINKIDKPEADPQKLKNQLLESNVLLEGYGGQIPSVQLSAQTGEGVDDLLDTINLIAELEELTSEDGESLEAVVVEASMDSQRGAQATLLIRKGHLKTGATIAGSTTWAKIKSMEDFAGEQIKEADPSSPVVITGLASVPQVGEKFVEVANQKEAEERMQRKERKEEEGSLLEVEDGQKVVNIILKSDVEGTLEAVHSVLRSIDNEHIKLRILQEGVGEITDSDVRLAGNGKALVVGFRIKPNSTAKNLVELQGVNVVTYETIYDLVEGVRSAILDYIEPETTEESIGKFKVVKIFRTETSRMIVGGKIIEGELKRGATLNVIREDKVIGKGKLNQLKSVDKAIERAEKGEEAGILFDGGVKLEEGDILEALEKRTSKPIL